MSVKACGHEASNEDSLQTDVHLWCCRGWRIALDIASALVFLHSKGLVHLDVKSLNILLKSGRTEAKLGDLGLARLVPDGRLALQNTLPGTPAYSAPEVIQAQLQWRLRTQGRKDQFKTEVRLLSFIAGSRGPGMQFVYWCTSLERVTDSSPATLHSRTDRSSSAGRHAGGHLLGKLLLLQLRSASLIV